MTGNQENTWATRGRSRKAKKAGHPRGIAFVGPARMETSKESSVQGHGLHPPQKKSISGDDESQTTEKVGTSPKHLSTLTYALKGGRMHPEEEKRREGGTFPYSPSVHLDISKPGVQLGTLRGRRAPWGGRGTV